jgi:hypothetical protein
MAHLKQMLDFRITQKCFCLFTFWKFDDDHTCGFPITLNVPLMLSAQPLVTHSSNT